MTKDELLLAYFERPLSEEEQLLWEKWHKEDKTFADEVEFQKNVKTALHRHERTQLKKQLVAFEQQGSIKLTYRKLWAASIAACLLVGLVTWFFMTSVSDEKLYAEYFQPYPNVVVPTVRGGAAATNEALYLYEQDNFEGALLAFQKMDTLAFARFYESQCYLALNKPDKAIDLLENLHFADTNFEVLKKWYLALAYLKIQESEKAKPLLEEVAAVENSQQRLAKELIEKRW